MAMNDQQLRHDIEAELEWDMRFDSRQIGVAIKNGVVALSGHVGSYAEKRAAEEAAQSVTGVRAVANDILIELPTTARRTDAELAESVVAALQSNVSVPADRIQAFVRDGWVTLEGEVSMWFQKSAAEATLSSLAGIKGVSNNIGINAQASVGEVKDKIEDAFRRQARLDANNISVTANGGTVTLEGTVQTWGERQAAESAAWQAPGVSQVIDKVVVRPEGCNTAKSLP
ncbi:MAG TPA: BON domain-containing protein [Steroidobacteraceae bacterium]|nr:BON domain-containing protein [Steroidobacteraceae bacterium]